MLLLCGKYKKIFYTVSILPNHGSSGDVELCANIVITIKKISCCSSLFNSGSYSQSSTPFDAMQLSGIP